jgi:hypothetical protein
LLFPGVSSEGPSRVELVFSDIAQAIPETLRKAAFYAAAWRDSSHETLRHDMAQERARLSAEVERTVDEERLRAVREREESILDARAARPGAGTSTRTINVI